MSSDLRIGEKIKALRLASDLTQSELADRAGLTKGFISQLENEQTSIQIDSLADLLEALGVSLSEFFANNEDKIIFSRDERVKIEDRGIQSFELLVPGSTNNQMDPILLEMKPGEELEEREPHPGEQFGYVLRGTVTLKFGKNLYTITKGNCFYFEAIKKQQLMNTSDKSVQLLWVTTPPQM